jgi:hypothetical protein
VERHDPSLRDEAVDWSEGPVVRIGETHGAHVHVGVVIVEERLLPIVG